MRTFLRRIRRSLIESSRAQKYLIYGIGEIALVVIGILIALQINNWNNSKIERREEIEILKNIKADFDNTIQEFVFLNELRQQVIEGTILIFDMASGDLNNPSKLMMDSLLGITFLDPTYNNQSDVLDVLFSSGKINLITNSEIKNKVISWPGYIEDMAEEEIYASDIFHGPYYEVLAKFVVMEDIMNTIISPSRLSDESNSLGFYSFKDDIISSNHKELLKDRSFLNHLSMRSGHMKVTLMETKTLISQAQEIIHMIDGHIEEITR